MTSGWTIDPDKIPDVPFSSMIVDGVVIESRYGKKAEYQCMQKALLLLQPADRAIIKSVICDSKCTCSYIVECRDRGASHMAVELLNAAFLLVGHGHNGITCWDSDARVESNWLADIELRGIE